MATRDADVIVIGAGLSGLMAARALARSDASAMILEAADRVGGKMHTVSIAGCAVDLGAHWVGPTQRRVLALADELGIELEPQFVEGRNVAVLGGERHEFKGELPLISLLGTAETVVAIARVELARRRISATEPWNSRRARRLDGRSLAAWMEGLRSTNARSTFALTARTVFGAEPEELSFLYFLWYAQCAGGLQGLIGFEGGAQDSHLRGGSQQLCERVAAELGERVHLDLPVTAIRHDSDGVVVAAGKAEYAARRAIVAVSPSVAARIAFDPPLPADRARLAARMPLGAYAKGIAVYAKPWWRASGLSGTAFADDGLVQMVVDASPPEGEVGILVSFVTGQPAREFARLDSDARRAGVLDGIATMLGPEARDPFEFRDVVWQQDRWAGGGPVGIMGPGTLSSLGPALRAPIGSIHWAGTDAAVEWNGYMEGAIEAGERAAAEVLGAS